MSAPLYGLEGALYIIQLQPYVVLCDMNTKPSIQQQLARLKLVEARINQVSNQETVWL